MIESWLVDTITKITTTRNKWGDTVFGSESDINCRFREITDFNRSSNNREEVDADAMIWFAGNHSVALGDIYEYDGQRYRVDKITKARRGKQTNVEFIKCEVIKHRQIS